MNDIHRRDMGKRIVCGCLVVLAITVLYGCTAKDEHTLSEDQDIDKSLEGWNIQTGEADTELSYMEEVPLDYAECFHIYRYEGGYSLITMDDGSNYFLVPEGQEVPECVTYPDPDAMNSKETNDRETIRQLNLTGDSLQNSTVILHKPLNQIYMSSSGAMALFDSADALTCVRFSSLDADSWYIDHAREAIENGDILYAGKYSEPDYELLLEEQCSMALENTMILHKPETKEKLEELGIPVMIERSSYEPHPLGRTEWIKVYGELTGHFEQAETFYETQKQIVENLERTEPTGKTVAFFYVSESGTVVTRKSSDYVAKMIEIAGGDYVFEHLGEEDNASSTVNMTMEDFYVAAKDADYLVYNASIDDPMTSVDELVAENELFLDFKAVQNDNVWCTGRNMYQSTDVIGEIIQSFHVMMTDESAEDLKYMVRIH